MKHLTLVSVLFHPRDADLGKKHPSFRTPYTPEWVDKLHRGFSRNLEQPFRHICLTYHDKDEFQEDVTPVPFAYDEHVGTWMCINEVFRPDLEIERGVVAGLDTIICGPMDDLINGPYKAGFPLNPLAPHTQESDRVNNAIVIFDGDAMAPLWTNYINDPEGVSARCIHPVWGQGVPSEMVYWRTECPVEVTAIDDYFPNRIASNKLQVALDPSIIDDLSVVYFHGGRKNNTGWVHDKLKEHWV